MISPRQLTKAKLARKKTPSVGPVKPPPLPARKSLAGSAWKSCAPGESGAGRPAARPRAEGDVESTELYGAALTTRCSGHFFIFYFIQWKPTDTWPRDRCGRAQLVLLPSLADFLHLGADL